MKATELVAKMKTESPALFGKVDDKVAVRLVQHTLTELGKQLTQAEEGTVRIPGLGRFKVKQVEKEKDGAKKTMKKIGFRVAKPVTEEDRQKRKEKKATKKAAAAPAA